MDVTCAWVMNMHFLQFLLARLELLQRPPSLFSRISPQLICTCPSRRALSGHLADTIISITSERTKQVVLQAQQEATHTS